MHHAIPVIARQIKMNEFRLKYVFRYLYKTGFVYLLYARMEAAKRMLVQTQFSIKEITEQTGYQSQSSFILAFRKHFGYTPGSVRRNAAPLRTID